MCASRSTAAQSGIRKEATVPCGELWSAPSDGQTSPRSLGRSGGPGDVRTIPIARTSPSSVRQGCAVGFARGGFGVSSGLASDRATRTAGAGSYDAFLSYSHQDLAAARGLQKGLHAVGRRFGQLRALRVFRDATELSASPDLWEKVSGAMDESRYLVVLLSPAAQASKWVNREVEHWLATKGPDRVLLVLADGTLLWDDTDRCFDPRSTAAPPRLAEPHALAAEPFYPDISGNSPWDPQDAAFRDKVAELAATIHGKSKAELVGEDLSEQRRVRRLRNAAITALVLLTTCALIAANVAVGQSREARRQRDEAVALVLATESRNAISSDGALALALAAEGVTAAEAPPWQAVDSLVRARQSFDRLWTPVLPPLRGHQEAVTALAFHPEGGILASGGQDGTLRLWDTGTGQQLGEPLHAEGWVEALAIEPGRNLIAAAALEEGVRVWDLDTRTLVARLPGEREVEFSPDGSRIAVADRESLAVFETDTWQSVPLPENAENASEQLAETGMAISYSPDGRRLATLTSYSELENALGNRVWVADLATGLLDPSPDSIGPSEGGHSMQITSVSYSPDGTRVASGSEDRSVRIWDAATGLLAEAPLEGHSGDVTAVDYSPDGSLLASSSGDGTVRLWDPATGSQIGAPLPGRGGGVETVEFSPGGELLASGNEDGTIWLWGASSGSRGVRQVQRGLESGRAVALSRDGSIAAVAGYEDEFGVWSLPDGTLQRTVDTGDPEGLRDVAVSPDGLRIVTAGTDIRFWDAATGRQLGEPLRVAESAVTALEFSPDGELLATCDLDGVVRLWRAAELGSASADPRVLGTDLGRELAFSPDGSTLAVVGGNYDGMSYLQLWDVATGVPASDNLQPQGHDIFSVGFSPDGATVVTTAGTAAKVWDVDSGQEVAWLQDESRNAYVYSVAFSPDGMAIATGSEDGVVNFWDAREYQSIGEQVSGGTASARDLAFGSSALLVVAHDDGGVVLVDAPWIVEQACQLAAHVVDQESVRAAVPAGWTLDCAYADDGAEGDDGADGETG